MGKNVKIFMFHVNSHQRMTLADFNNQAERMAHPVAMNQPLSAATSVIIQWSHKQNGHCDRYGGYAWAQ